MENTQMPDRLNLHDALLIVDVQNDFLNGGSLGISHSRSIVAVINKYIALFNEAALPVYASRDWHPPDHCSFNKQGGLWPEHCVADTVGADFAADLALPASTHLIFKATQKNRDAYSAFEGTGLADDLQKRGVRRVFICGLATDYCVFYSVKDAVSCDFQVILLLDAIKAVDVNPGDGDRALEKMKELGAVECQYEELIL